MQKQASFELKHYQLANKIGTGSLGDVYRLKINNSKDFASAKVITKAKDTNSKADITNFQREISNISKISHGSINKIIGFSPTDFKNENNPVLVSEFVSNGSLNEIIELDRKSKSTIYLNDTRKLINIYGIASGMSNLHSYSIIHHDLKPSNILLNDYLCPQITDIEILKFFKPQNDNKSNAIYISHEIWKK